MSLCHSVAISSQTGIVQALLTSLVSFFDNKAQFAADCSDRSYPQGGGKRLETSRPEPDESYLISLFICAINEFIIRIPNLLPSICLTTPKWFCTTVPFPTSHITD